MSTEALKTPALDLVKDNHPKTQFLHEFLEFLQEEHDVFLGKYVTDPESHEEWTDTIHGTRLDDYMYEFIGTTAADVEKERQAIYDSLPQ